MANGTNVSSYKAVLHFIQTARKSQVPGMPQKFCQCKLSERPHENSYWRETFCLWWMRCCVCSEMQLENAPTNTFWREAFHVWYLRTYFQQVFTLEGSHDTTHWRKTLCLRDLWATVHQLTGQKEPHETSSGRKTFSVWNMQHHFLPQTFIESPHKDAQKGSQVLLYDLQEEVHFPQRFIWTHVISQQK